MKLDVKQLPIVTGGNDWKKGPEIARIGHKKALPEPAPLLGFQISAGLRVALPLREFLLPCALTHSGSIVIMRYLSHRVNPLLTALGGLQAFSSGEGSASLLYSRELYPHAAITSCQQIHIG